MSNRESLFDRLKKNRDRDTIAVRFENKEIRYPALCRSVRQMAAYLQSVGLKSGDTVTVSLPNIPVCIYVLYACNALGVVQNIVHPLAPAAEILRTAKETGSKLVLLLSSRSKEEKQTLANSEFRVAYANPLYDVSPLKRLLCNCKCGFVHENERTLALDRFRSCKPITQLPAHDTAAPSLYLHSGGTTSAPKTILLSDDALNNLVAKVDGIVDGDVVGKSILTVLPAFHGFGLGMGIHTALYWGGTCALMTRFKLKDTIRWIDEGKVNYLLGVPLLYQKLMKDPAFSAANLSALECAFVGGDNVPQSLIAEFNALMQRKGSPCVMLEGYGLTETVTVCTVNTARSFRACSVGKPLRGISVTVRDEAEQCLPVREVGEVYIAGDTLMNGYFRDEAGTAATVRTLDGKQWIRTGDLGFLDEDGFLFLKGRKKRVFKIAGINVYPAEAERIATDMVNDVFDAALEMFESPKPHLVLFLVQNRDSKKTQDEIRAALNERMQQQLLKYSLPGKIVFLAEFPKTQVGKIDHKAFTDPTA